MPFVVVRSLIPNLLERRGWTQAFLEERANLKPKSLSPYITGRNKNLPITLAIPVADALGVHPRELVELRKV